MTAAHDHSRHRRRRRVRSSLPYVAIASALMGSSCSWAAQTMDMGPGTVSGIGEDSYWARTLREGTLTTTCDASCTAIPNAVVCVTNMRGINQATCEAEYASHNVACQTSNDMTVLCLSPARFQWRFQFTSDPETLVLARQSADPTVMTLDARHVNAMDQVLLANDTAQLYVSAVDPTERLDIALTSETIAQWQYAEVLSLQNIDLSGLTPLATVFPKLVSLTLSRSQLTLWPVIAAAPSLSILDVSSNQLIRIPEGSLPPSLTVLNISDNNLDGLPIDIEQMTGLIQLAASHNRLADLVQFPKLSRLQQLYLSACVLTKLPTGLANLEQLHTLDLSNNALTFVPDHSFPASLTTLHLHNCDLTSLPREFDLDKTWEVIDLSANPLTDASFTTIQFRAKTLILDQVRLTSIPLVATNWNIEHELSLSGNPFGDVVGTDLPSTITSLRLADCQLTNVPANLSTLTLLESLDLSRNELRIVSKGSLPSQLTALYLSTCGLNALPDDVTSMKDNLVTLDLSGNTLASITLTKFSHLERLNLANNSLTQFPVDILKLPKLTHLDLRGNPMTNVTLTPSQIDVLTNQLRVFTIDASVFTTTETECVARQLVRGKYSICTQVRPRPDPIVVPTTLDPGPPLPSTNKTDTGSSMTKASRTVTNGLIGGAIAIVLAVSFVVSKRQPHEHDVDEFEGLHTTTATRRHGPIDIWEDENLQHWRLDVLDVELLMQIGIGSHTVVWLARYLNDTVVVKRLHEKRQGRRVFERFIDEIKCIGQLDHPKIVFFFGITWTTDSDLQVVLEFMSNGDLQKYLATTRHDPSARLWTARKLGMAIDMAEALVYIHARNPVVVHRDLKSHHVLLDENGTAKLSHFSVGPEMAPTELAMTGAVGTNRWIAPEVLSGSADYDESTDMYAFGVILSELDTHEFPFSDITLSNGEPLNEIAMLELLSAGALQPSLSSDCPSVIATLTQECIEFDPSKRPTARQVLYQLTLALESLNVMSRETNESARETSRHEPNESFMSSDMEMEIDQDYLL